MKTVILRSFLIATLAALLSHFIRTTLHTDLFLSDVGGLSAFLSVFGTLYGILAAFVVFEVWNQYNHTSELIDKEAQGLERLYRLALYFRDPKLTADMKAAIHAYASIIINGKFRKLGAGKRNKEHGIAFRKVAELIRNIEFNDEHDSIVFDQILEHYGNLGQIRTERMNESLSRLPVLLKSFIYISSFFALATFLFMPFSNPYYAFLAVAVIGFIQSMIFHIVEDLDNPFLGHWKLTPEPFARALKHIEEDY
jgi:hypothetical protein